MAITHVNSEDYTGDKTGRQSMTHSYTPTAGDNKILVVFITGADSNLIDRNWDSLVFNTSETFINAVDLDATGTGFDIRGFCYYLVNPTITTANIFATNEGVGCARVAMSIHEFDGVDGTTPMDVTGVSDTKTAGEGTTNTISITPINTDTWLVDYISVRNDTGTHTAPANQTFRSNQTTGVAPDDWHSVTTDPVTTAESHDMVRNSLNTDRGPHLCIALRPVVAAAVGQDSLYASMMQRRGLANRRM